MRVWLLVLGLFWAAGPLFAQVDLRPAYRAFAQAQSASEPQRSEQLRRALAVLQYATETAPSAALYYDQGQIYRQLTEPALALWAYQKALQFNPRLAPAQEAAQEMRRQLELPRRGLSPANLLAQVPAALWGIAMIAAWGVGWALRRRSKPAAGGCWVLALILALGLSQPLWRPWWPAPALVVEPAGLRLGPGAAYEAAGSLPLGREVRPLESVGQWAAVEQEGQVLWVRRSALKAL